jgi:hypothetical protein
MPAGESVVFAGEPVAPVPVPLYNVEVVQSNGFVDVRMESTRGVDVVEFGFDLDATDGEIYIYESLTRDGQLVYTQEYQVFAGGPAYTAVFAPALGVWTPWAEYDSETGQTGDTIVPDTLNTLGSERRAVARALSYLNSYNWVAPDTLGYAAGRAISVFIVESCVWDYGPGDACHSCCATNVPPPAPNQDCQGFTDSFACCYQEANSDYCRRLCNANPGSVIFGTIDLAACFIPFRGFF